MSAPALVFITGASSGIGQALAQRALARGEGMDPALALPLYVRDKVAQTTAEREAQKAAAQP